MKTRIFQLTFLTLVLTIAVRAANAQTYCSNSITACGCAINTPGTYTVDADLTASQGLTTMGSCLDVTASDVKLFTNGHSITGAGTGTGIHLLGGANTIFLSAAGPGSTYSTISGWQYAVESQASKVTAEGFYFVGNSTGLLLKGAQGNSFGCVGAFDNAVYGVWIWGGSNNLIAYSGVWDNGVAGVYVGCKANGPSSPACSGSGSTSSGNFILSVLSYSSAAESYGLAVQSGNTGNMLVDNQFFSNTADDLYDGNSSANSNVWHANLFATANKSYIQ